MHIQNIKDKNQWQEFIQEQSLRTFLQHWQWGEFYTAMGQKIFRLGMFEKDQLIGLAQVIKIIAKRGSFLFVPHGPVKKKDLASDLWNIDVLVERLQVLAKEENCSFVRISPLLPDTKENIEIFTRCGFRDAPIHMHSELGWILDISPTEEELLSAMRKNTRYSIKRAQKKGVTIEKSKNKEDVDIFYKVYEATVRKKHFVPFSRQYLQKEFEALSSDDMAQWFFARYNGQVISAAMIIFTKHSGFYHQGANTRLYPEVPASELLLWEAIKQAKERGCKEYNFWGISPKNQPNHPWAGTTYFKKGFGGFAEAYIHAKDLIISQKYWINWIIETARRIKRRY